MDDDIDPASIGPRTSDFVDTATIAAGDDFHIGVFFQAAIEHPEGLLDVIEVCCARHSDQSSLRSRFNGPGFLLGVEIIASFQNRTGGVVPSAF